MSSVRYLLIGVTCLLLVIHSESFLWDDVVSVWNDVKKPLCKGVFGIACPIGLNAGAGAITVGTAGAGAVVWDWAAAGSIACSVAKDELCRRNLDPNTVILPFSDNFDDYDKDSDGNISFKEFLVAVMSTVNLADPEDLIIPFKDSDKNGDKQLDKEEFVDSEFLFPEENQKRIMASRNSAEVLPVLRQLLREWNQDPYEFEKNE